MLANRPGNLGVLALLAIASALWPGQTTIAAGGKQASVKYHPVRTDRYGDPLPTGAIGRLGTIRFCSPGHTLAIAFAPDGKTIATASRDIRFWDAATGKHLHTFSGPKRDWSQTLDFTPDGKTLIVGSHYTDAIYLYDVATGKQTACLGPPPFGREISEVHEASDVRRLFLLPGGKTIASRRRASKPAPEGGVSSWREFSLWDIKQRKLLDVKQPSGGCRHTFFAGSPDGKMVVSDGVDETLLVWERGTGKNIHVLAGHKEMPLCAAFAYSGHLLASGAMDHEVRLWDLTTGQLLRRLERHERPVLGLIFHPDGVTLLSISRDRLCRWEIATGKLVREFRSTADNLQAMSLAPDGRRLAVVSGRGKIWVWDVATGNETPALEGHRTAVSAVVFASDGRTVISAGADGLMAWDVTNLGSSRRLSGRSREASHIVFQGHGKTFLTGGYWQAPKLWDWHGGKLLGEFQGPKEGDRLRLSHDGKLAVTINHQEGASEPSVLLWDVAERRLLKGIGPPNSESPYRSIDFALLFPGGKRLLTGGINKPIQLLGLPEGKSLGQWSDDSAHAGALSPDSKIVSVICFGHVRFFDSTSGKQLGSFGARSGGGASWDCPLVFSPDGRTLAIAGEDGDIRLCEVATRKGRRRLLGHVGYVRGLAFSSDGRTLVSAGQDTTLLVWDLTDCNGKVHPEEAWKALSDDNGERGFEAIWQLAAVPDQAVCLLKARLSPARLATPAELDKLVADLDSDSYVTRASANQELARLGEVAEAALVKLLQGKPKLEQRRRAEDLLAKLEAQRLAPSGARLRQLRAIEALERIGTLEARQLLQSLASGASVSRLTHEAQASLSRLEKLSPGKR
jgi:WD40 repeat protein